MQELEAILLAWFMQACTAKASIDGPKLKGKALHAAVRPGMGRFWTSDGRTDHFNKIHNLVHKSMSGESAIVNPNKVMAWKRKVLP